jgi:predicted DNA repair protein MutK
MNLNERDNSFSDAIGRSLIWALPKLIKSLSVIGTIALLLVSGGIFTHNIHFLHGIFETIPSMLVEFVLGLVVGFLMVLIISGSKKLWKLISN